MDDHIRDRRDFLRTNSICATPESLLLEFVLRNDLENVTRLIEINNKLLNHIYFPDYNKPILLIACSEETVQPETIKTLIILGADLYFSSEIDENWQALHFAACSTRSNVLKLIIENLKNPDDINATANGSTALHVLIKHGRSDQPEEFVKCAKLLVQQGIDVNLGDSNGVSAILWAAKKSYKHIIKVILEDSLAPVDLDTHKSRGKTARDILLSDNLYDGLLPKVSDNNNETDENLLFKYLQTGRENAFVNFKKGNIGHLVNASNNSTLLQTSCKKHLPKAVEHLLRSGADPNLTTTNHNQTPIEIAVESGYWDIFQLLLDHNARVPNSILTTLLKCVDNDQFPEVGISHAKCYEILLTKLKTNKGLLDVNETDNSNNSPLHYAVRYAESEKVKELLELGASLGSKNKYGVMPVQDIDPQVLKEHLDECVQFELSNKIDKEDFLVTFDYRTLIPPSKKFEINDNFDKSDPETNFNDAITRELVAETEVIAYMSKTAEFKHLLTHPVIVSFLFMKWQRINWLFYVNLLFYIIFSCSLVVYIFASYTNPDSSETTPFVTLLAYTSKVIFFLTFLVLVFRELFQMAISPDGYFKNFENYIEIILIFCTGSILCNANILPGSENSIDDTKRILSAISILLAAFELVLMVGQHPKLSTNVVMLRTVSFNFFKFLVWYSLLIIAFALSFYILFSETKPISKNETTDAQEEEDLFADPGKSVFKTIVMLTGEFDAGSMNFQRFPITSKIMFSLFIFMIAIILLNLLNGLAVSDTYMIKKNAELVGHVTRAQHIRYVESMILGNVLPSKLIRVFKNVCCCLPIDGSYTFSVFKPLAQRVCLFPHFLDYELSVYPNKYGKIYLPTECKVNGNSGNHCYGCHNLYLDKDTVKRTNSIVHERREELKNKQAETDLKKINDKMDAIERLGKDNKLIFLLIHNLTSKFDNYLKHMGEGNG